MSFALDDQTSRIEVSGWDEDEMFFVEKSEFFYDQVTGKHITLEHNLPDGSLIFLRLIHSRELLHTAPVAYKANFVGFDRQGLYQFSLLPAYPLYPASRYPIN